MSYIDLNKLPIKNIKIKCKELGIIKYSKKNKKELIEMIKNNIKIIDNKIIDDKIIDNKIIDEIEIDNKIIDEIEIDKINKRIKKEICYNTLIKLSDTSLISEYKNSSSVKNEIKKLSDILEKYIDDLTKQKIIQEYLLQLIPAGTKGVIRGNKFNNIVKTVIIELGLDLDIFEINFEKKCIFCITTEIPDWYILEKSTNRIIIGMNQLDIWGGGQQINRGSKYIDNNVHNTKNSKLLCVVCNEIQFKNKKNKAYKLFEIGFKHDTLCYINNLHNIIISWFSIC